MYFIKGKIVVLWQASATCFKRGNIVRLFDF